MQCAGVFARSCAFLMKSHGAAVNSARGSFVQVFHCGDGSFKKKLLKRAG
uniref:Uncharacterized protein n=1 Tax=Anguilla anguilla TaxID=7936 RepID=A0A0E9SAV5_ANGAN